MSKHNLERQTQAYWKVTNCWYRRRGTMTVEQANKQIRQVRMHTGPQRLLHRLADALRWDIIQNQHTPTRVEKAMEEA